MNNVLLFFLFITQCVFYIFILVKTHLFICSLQTVEKFSVITGSMTEIPTIPLTPCLQKETLALREQVCNLSASSQDTQVSWCHTNIFHPAMFIMDKQPCGSCQTALLTHFIFQNIIRSLFCYLRRVEAAWFGE